ncbi:MAG TPA: hypothetical protein VGX92_22360 [Pyrinomonadaceae bacterium]|jgi:hypothetical protein|nr:hypothetical protein [Pyrinomonadaceae bacterium]
MPPLRFKRELFICALLLCSVLSGTSMAQATKGISTGSASNDDLKAAVDLEIQLHLLVASNAAGEGAKLPAALDATSRQLRSALPFTNYRWAATYINRVSNGAASSIRGIAGPLLGTTSQSSQTPSFYDMQLNDVMLTSDARGVEVVQLRIHFGARLPIVAGPGSGTTGPLINYESTGISTFVRIKENEPVVIGTMSLGPSNEMLVLVVTAKKLD